MNKPHFLLLLFSLFIAVLIPKYSLAVESKNVKSMSLAEAVALALRQNRTVESAYLNRILEKFDLIVARDEFNPQISFNVTANQNAAYNEFRKNHIRSLTKTVSSNIALNLKTGGSVSFSWDNSDSGQDFNNFDSSLRLSLSQPLLKGAGADVATVSQLLAERAEEMNLLNLQSTLMNTITSVIRTYRDFLLSQRQLEILETSLERSHKQFEETQALIDAGRKPRMSLVYAEVDLANQELIFRNNKSDLDGSRLALLKILNLDKNMQIEPTESLDDLTVDSVALDVETLKNIAFNKKLSYLSAKIGLENAKTNLMLAKNAQLWDLDFFASYNISGDDSDWAQTQSDITQLKKGNYSLGLSLVIPFRDLSRKQTLLAAQIGLQQAQLDFAELQDDIETDLQDIVRNINVQWEQLELTKRARELTEKQLEIEMEKFKLGYEGTSNVQIIDFQDDLVNAENGEVSAKISYLNALTNLDEFLGTTLETWGVDIESQRDVNLP